MSDEGPLLAASGLRVLFPVRSPGWRRAKQFLRAVDGVSMEIRKGETLGVVGESGCGKTTLGKALLGLLEPTEGDVLWRGERLSDLGRPAWGEYRRSVQVVFQDPWSSLNPRRRVLSLLMDPLLVQGQSKSRAKARALEALELVGLAREHGSRYPHEFSGGQRQRVAIARAIVPQPQIIVLDEPVSSLDVSVQGQVLNLLKDLQLKQGLSYVFIAHDLATVSHMSDRIAVMYLGEIVERGDAGELLRQPKHPYTQALTESVLSLDRQVLDTTVPLVGDVPSPVNPPSGCRFHTRCPEVMDVCETVPPVLEPESDRVAVACHLYERSHLESCRRHETLMTSEA